MPRQLPDLMVENQVIKNRYKVGTQLAAGCFGQIYKGEDIEDGGKPVAIKVESNDDPLHLIRLEALVFIELEKKFDGASTTPNTPNFYGCGSGPNYSYIVMQLLGSNLMDLRKQSPVESQRFSFSTTFRLGREMLRGIRDIHKIGFLHRDIKPANFAIGAEEDTKRVVYIFDFGLARPYKDCKGKLRRPRESANFRGTTRYASINCHQGKEAGRHDDLWSWFYILVEFARGFLEWKNVTGKDEILKYKLKWKTDNLAKGAENLTLPTAIPSIASHLKGLTYDDTPDYDHLDGLLKHILDIVGGPTVEDDPLDWEENFATLRSEEARNKIKKQALFRHPN